MPSTAQEQAARVQAILERDVMGARRMAEQGLAAHPDSPELREALALTYIRVNDMHGALNVCQSLPIEKSTTTMLEIRGIAHLQLGENEAAFRVLRAVTKIQPLALATDRMGLALQRLGRPGEAVGVFKTVIGQLGPTEAVRHSAMRQLIYALRDERRWEEADQTVQALIAVYRQSPLPVASAIASADMEVPYKGWLSFLNKGSLARTLDAWSGAHPHQPRFWPESFVLPGDEAKLAQFKESVSPLSVFAVKPENLYGGQGIKLTRDPLAHIEKQAVIQRYIDNPYLLGGRKFHARVYVLVSGLDPARAYVYREGIARLAPERYALDDAALERPGIHITNTALHIGHPELVLDQDPAKENVGNVWTMSAVYRQMQADGLDAYRVWWRITDIARRFVSIAIDAGILASQAKEHTRYCFPPRVFGLDVLIDATGRPWLIEYQRNPALAGTPMVNRVNGTLCRNILGMSAYPLIPRLGGRGSESLDDPVFRSGIEEEAEHAARGLFERIL